MSVETRIPDSKTKSNVKCYHCGLVCPSDSIFIGEKFFCCQGCRTVYEILEENNLCQYYNLNSTPGIRLGEVNKDVRFGYLDDETVKRQLSNFSDGTISTVTFKIPSIHCSSCIWLLENLFTINPAISNSRVDFLKKELSVSFIEKDITLRQVVELITSIGYEPQINLKDLDKKVKKETDRSLYLKIGVAGFCFANIMLFSLPEYFSGGKIDPSLRSFFQFLNILLAIPVFFYSSSEFFKSALSGLKHKIVNIDVPISLGILTLFFRSIFEIITIGEAGYMDSFVALVFLLLVGKLFQKKTFDFLSFERDYKAYFPVSITKSSGTAQTSIPLSKLSKGDRILVRNQELIPADSILIDGHGFIDYSFVTGESNPVPKQSGDLLYAGGRQVGGAIELDVVKDVSQSYLTQLWNTDTFEQTYKSKITSITNLVAKYFTFIVITIATIAAVYWFQTGPILAMNAFTAVLIIACPCALALSIPFTFGNSLRILARNKFYLKNTDIIELLAKVDTIVFDKTGTLTKSQDSGIKFVSINGKRDFTDYERKLIKSLVHQSAHPLSRRIESALNGGIFTNILEFAEIPGRGIEGIVDDHHVKIGSAAFVGQETCRNNGTMASVVSISIDDQSRGCYQLENIYRPGLERVIKYLGNLYDLALLSGDNESEKSNLLRFFKDPGYLYFNQSPMDKLEFVKKLQRENKKVLMIGDGLNDAGALRQSDVGISVSEDLNSFSPACDAILEAKSFPQLINILRFAKTNMNIIIASFTISFLYNIFGLGFAVRGILSPLISAILMPLSSISVILFATGSTYFFAKLKGLR